MSDDRQTDGEENKATHVYPLGDMREHVVDGGYCWCAPTVKEGGGLVIHNSFDERERFERGERKPS